MICWLCLCDICTYCMIWCLVVHARNITMTDRNSRYPNEFRCITSAKRILISKTRHLWEYLDRGAHLDISRPLKYLLIAARQIMKCVQHCYSYKVFFSFCSYVVLKTQNLRTPAHSSDNFVSTWFLSHRLQACRSWLVSRIVYFVLLSAIFIRPSACKSSDMQWTEPCYRWRNAL